MEPTNALSRLEAQLHLVTGRRGRQTLRRWRAENALLADAPLNAPKDLPSWVWELTPADADEVLRDLVRLAQDGDEVALLAVIASLRPGLLALVGRARLPVGDVVAEAAAVILAYPLERRRRIAAGIVLDVRHAFWQERQRQPEIVDPGLRDRLAELQAPGEFGVEESSAEQLFQLVCGAWRAGHLKEDDARIIIETRVLGDLVATAAARRGVTEKAIYERRHRAEARLAEAAA